MTTLYERLQDPRFLAKLREYQEMSGYQSPTSGRMTYNKVVHHRSFAIFTDIIMDMAPLEYLLDHERQAKVPSVANVLTHYFGKEVNLYPIYLCMNASLDEFMEEETEEDQENLDSLLEEVDELGMGVPMVGLAVHKSEAMQSAHASAFIVWKGDDGYTFAFYDPLAYKKGSRKAYDFAELSYKSERFEQKIEFLNLDKYCYHRSKDEFHCPQYVINTEYCYIFAVYFLYQWIQAGYLREWPRMEESKQRMSLRKTIRSTYIVKPPKLTRGDTRESMTYRVVMMAFVCKILKTYLEVVVKKKHRKVIENIDENRNKIEGYLSGFKEMYGFDLVGL
jgi:hypothetical protein